MHNIFIVFPWIWKLLSYFSLWKTWMDKLATVEKPLTQQTNQQTDNPTGRHVCKPFVCKCHYWTIYLKVGYMYYIICMCPSDNNIFLFFLDCNIIGRHLHSVINWYNFMGTLCRTGIANKYSYYSYDGIAFSRRSWKN